MEPVTLELHMSSQKSRRPLLPPHWRPDGVVRSPPTAYRPLNAKLLGSQSTEGLTLSHLGVFSQTDNATNLQMESMECHECSLDVLTFQPTRRRSEQGVVHKVGHYHLYNRKALRVLVTNRRASDKPTIRLPVMDRDWLPKSKWRLFNKTIMPSLTISQPHHNN